MSHYKGCKLCDLWGNSPPGFFGEKKTEALWKGRKT
jgi:hypothetical protein